MNSQGIKSPPPSLAMASTTINIMQRWVAKLESETTIMEDMLEKVNDTDGSIK